MELDAEPRFLSRGPLLALDTSTDRATVVLDACEDHLHEAPRGLSRQHGRGLLASVRHLLRQAGLRPADLTAVGVGLGPGSFTGLRIGLTAAKTLAYAIGCPVFSVDSLEAIARNAPEDALHVVALGDAQRGDFFVADFARDRAGEPLQRSRPTRLERTDTWPLTVTSGTHVLGPPLGRAEPTWPAGVVRGEVEVGYPDGRRLIALVRERMAARPADEAWFLEPLYARGSAAEEKAAGAVAR